MSESFPCVSPYDTRKMMLQRHTPGYLVTVPMETNIRPCDPVESNHRSPPCQGGAFPLGQDRS